MRDLFDVIVVGGGIVGLGAAIAMQQRNFSVAILDASSLTRDMTVQDSRVYALNRASQGLLERLEVWQLVDKQRIAPYRHMHVWDAANGASIDFDARMISHDQLGVIVEEAVVRYALLQRAHALGIHFFPHQRVNAVNTPADGEILQVGCDGVMREAKLLIVADGANSTTRQLLNVPVTSWPYHQHALVATVQSEKPHRDTAYQVFSPDGSLAFLPLADLNQCSIVWSTSVPRAKNLFTLPEELFNQQLTQAFATKLGESKVVSARHQFPLYMRQAQQYSGKRWLLMGDAAHSIHPLAGLGLNLGLADLAAWLAKLDCSKNFKWSSTTLGAYQRQRKHAVWQTILLMEGLKTVFSHPFLPFATLRGMGLTICNQLPSLKRFLIEQAAGV